MAKPAPSRVAAALDYLERLKNQAAEFGGGVVENLADRARSVGGLAYEALATDPNMGRMTTAEFSEAASRPTPRLDQAAQDFGTIGRAIVTQPIQTGKAIVQGEIDRAQEATTSPRAAGEYAGSFIDPMRIAAALRRMPEVSAIAEYDPRFDPRVEEQPRLKALERTVESRGTVNPPEVSITEFEGKPFITSMSDRTAAGGLLRAINDVELARPVNLQGGQDFMFENPGMVWASQLGPSSKVAKAAKALKAEFGEDPLYLPWRMAPTGGDFATMTGETMLSYADATLNKKTRKQADSMIRRMIPGWAGIGTEEGIRQFRNAPDAVRKQLKNDLDVRFRDEGGLSIGEARLAVADPTQYTAPESGLQNVGVIYADQPLIGESGHAAYRAGIPGAGIGRLKEDVRVYELLEPAARARNIADPRNPSAADVRALQMKPYGGRITAELLKRLGY
jgi:hypothetical protein